jgi:16S rRNA (cytosine967-C5)-methyltransferase
VELPLLNVVTDEKPRQIAARILKEHQSSTFFIENLLDQALDRARLSAVDRSLCQQLVYGAVRWQATLDWLIARKTDGRTQKPALQSLLRLGLFQIFWLDRVPDHAAVHETVEQAKHSGFGPQAGFVNAVLRGYVREFDATKQLLTELKSTQPAIGYSHPEWLVTRWTKRWGTEKAARLMELNNTPPKTFARLNTLKTDAGSLLTRWREEDVEYDFIRRDWLDENLVFELKSHPSIASLKSFQQGLFYIQDPGTLLAVRELSPRPGETILDLCAAPGGKTTYLAQLMNNEGRIVAHDSSSERLKRVEENCARLGVTCVETAANELERRSPARQVAKAEDRRAGPEAGAPTPASNLPVSGFDRILIDAPCSNTGVMRRRVDLRWRIRPEEIERLRKMQLGLLQHAAPLLRPGGTLVYSTCSLEPEENQEVVEQFLREAPVFKMESQRELLPFSDEVDGAFVARFSR